jgi:hypothetical protein
MEIVPNTIAFPFKILGKILEIFSIATILIFGPLGLKTPYTCSIQNVLFNALCNMSKRSSIAIWRYYFIPMNVPVYMSLSPGENQNLTYAIYMIDNSSILI